MAMRIAGTCIAAGSAMAGIAHNAKTNSDNQEKKTHVQKSSPIIQAPYRYMPVAICDADTSKKIEMPPKKETTLLNSLANDVSEKFQRPVSALLPALGATGLMYPLTLITTLVQKENTGIMEVVRKVTDSGQKPAGLWAGATPILKMSALQRSAQFLVNGESKSWLEKNLSLSSTLNNLFSGMAASFTDTLIMAPAELKSIAAQIGRASNTPPADVTKTFSRSRGYVAIFARDLIANSCGFTIPQELREAWNMKNDVPQRLFTTFASLAMANIITTPIDGIKTAVLTQKDISAGKAIATLWDSNKLWSGYALRTFRQASTFSMVFVGAEYIHHEVFGKKESLKR